MEISVTGKALDLGDALQVHVTEQLTAGVQKYFDRSAEAQVTFDKEGSEIKTEITLHLASGVYLAAQSMAHDPYGSFDTALQKLEKRLRRYKRRLKDHHADNRDPLPAESASSYVIASSAQEEATNEGEEGDAPVIIAEGPATLRAMPVSDAVLQLELTDDPVVIFRNVKHGNLSVVYRREDGNIGWIDGRQ